MNSITGRNWDLLVCVNADAPVYWIILTRCIHMACIGKTRLTSWLQAQVCQAFLRMRTPTYLIYHAEGVPVYGGNLIRERERCVSVCVCAATIFSALGEFSENARKVMEQKCTSRRLAGQPIYIRKIRKMRLDYAPGFSLGKNTCHLSDVTRAHSRNL